MLFRMREPRRSTVTVNGLALSYLEWGAPGEERPSLLCLPGLVATAESFAAMADCLRSDQHVVAVDLPGNGGSETRRDLDVSFAGLAQLIVAFVPAAGLRRPVVVGHSHGGAVALRMAWVDSRGCSGAGPAVACTSVFGARTDGGPVLPFDSGESPGPRDPVVAETAPVLCVPSDAWIRHSL